MSADQPGTAWERTGLAWRRTSLAFAVNGVLLLRAADAWVQVAALVVLAFAGALATAGGTTFRRARSPGRLAGGRRRAELLTIAAVAVGALDCIAILR